MQKYQQRSVVKLLVTVRSAMLMTALSLSEGSIAGTSPEDQDAVDRRQHNKTLTAVSGSHCAANSVPRNCCRNCCAEQSHKDNFRSSAVEKQLKQKKSNFQAQLHLPILDLFCANLRVQHHSLLLISPGPSKASNFFVRVQLTSLLLISPVLLSLIHI